MDSERLIQMNTTHDKLYRGMILECHAHYLHVLTDQGDHLKINSLTNHKVGDLIYFLDEDILEDTGNPVMNHPLHLKSSFRALSALAAIFLIIVFLNFSMSNITYAVISLDINPSIELELNKSGQVLHANGFNPEATLLLSKLNLKRQSYDKAIETIFSQALLLGYTIDEHSVLIAVAPLKTQSKDMILDIEKHLNVYAKRLNAEVKIGDDHSYENKKNHHISLGRNLISNEHPNFDENDLQNMKIKDIFNAIEKDDIFEHEDDNDTDHDEDADHSEDTDHGNDDADHNIDDDHGNDDDDHDDREDDDHRHND